MNQIAIPEVKMKMIKTIKILKLAKINKKWAAFFGVLVLLVLLLTRWLMVSNEVTAPIVRESVIRRGSITIRVMATGAVQPQNRLLIKSPIEGRMDQVLVKEGDKVQKGQIIAWISSSERAALLDAARAKGGDEVKKWEEFYRPTPLVAPLDGMIISRDVEPGQTFTVNDALLVMSDRLAIKAQVDETDLAGVFVNQEAEVTLDSFPDQVFKSRVDQIAYEAKTINSVTSYAIDVIPKKPFEQMRSGMTANVTFIGQTKNDVIVIPNEYIRYESGHPIATVKTEDGPEQREIELGITDGKLTEVTSGLSEQDVVMIFIQKKEKKTQSNPFALNKGS